MDWVNKIPVLAVLAVAFWPGRAFSGFYLRPGDDGITLTKNKGFSVEGGVNLWSMRLNYALTPYGQLGSAQKISFKKRS
jgi:hypothetical protein